MLEDQWLKFWVVLQNVHHFHELWVLLSLDLKSSQDLLLLLWTQIRSAWLVSCASSSIIFVSVVLFVVVLVFLGILPCKATVLLELMVMRLLL